VAADTRLENQRRLPDPGRALDRQQPATTGGASDQHLDGCELSIALEELEPIGGRPAVELAAARLVSSIHGLGRV
jgi:hypothetical protein